MAGPLSGLRVVELAGIGPSPFAAMMLADHGADVIRVDRPGASHNPHDPLLRSRRSITLDLKQPDDIATLRALCRSADGLIEGFRPGVMERLGIGPEILLADNPRLVYGRMTGWGQNGPLAAVAGHDINYIAISGTLGAIGRAGEKPLPPINLAGDFGGGAMMLAFGMVSAILAARSGGRGQVVDCAMTDGSALLMAMMWGFRADGSWLEAQGVNLLDTGAPFYETADNRHVAIGAIEPQFYALLRQKLGIERDPRFDGQEDRARWPEQKRAFAELFRTRTLAEWCDRVGICDACFAPVLKMSEAIANAHNRSRQTFIDVAGTLQPAPAPRYSETPCAEPAPPVVPGTHTAAVLAELGRGTSA